VKVIYAPLVSDARGRFGGLVMSAWRATRLARRFRAPSNPKTAPQVGVRYIFINATRSWLQQKTNERAAWVSFALGKNFTGRNSYIAKQVPALKGDTDLTDLVGTPGDASTLAPSITSVTPGAGQLTVAIGAPSAPTGWTIVKAVAFAIRDTNWSAPVTGIGHYESEDATSPYEVIITGLAALKHQVRAFLVWTAPDASTRYSASAASDGTPT
jgi:hypothetical protein